MICRVAESSQELSRKGKDAASLGNKKAECSLKSDSNVHNHSDSESEDTWVEHLGVGSVYSHSKAILV